MNLQTKIPLSPQRFNQIDYNSKVLLLGSCFSENIGDKFSYFKFQTLQNPLGISFHPLAIERLITNAINEKKYKAEDLIFNNEQWHCSDAHSRLSSSSKDDILSQLNRGIEETHNFIKEASHIVITLGTAWAYRFIETDSYVANCHKIPQKKFIKELLSVEAIAESIDAITSLVKSVNPKVSFIFTVSPVRHIKDGFIENTLSKSHLITAIHKLVEPRHKRFYFPSYEFMMDELRDYRFYNEDMIHPSPLAIGHIWSRFKTTWFSEEAISTLDEVEVIQKGLSHKPFNPSSEAHKTFLQTLQTKITLLQTKFPHIRF